MNCVNKVVSNIFHVASGFLFVQTKNWMVVRLFLFCLMSQKLRWGYSAFSQTWLVEVAT